MAIRVVGLEALRLGHAAAAACCHSGLLTPAQWGLWLTCAWSAGDWSLLVAPFGRASAVAVMGGEALGKIASSAAVPDQKPAVAAPTANRLRQERNPVCHGACPYWPHCMRKGVSA